MSQMTLSERPYVNSNLFSSHYLDERVRERDEWDCDDEAREVMEVLQSLHELEGELVPSYNEDALIDNWIDEILDTLGFGTQVEVTLPNGGGFVDGLLFENSTARRDAAMTYLNTENTVDLFDRGLGLVEAKQWDVDFTKRFSDQRPYRNASHQIKHYLENTPSNIQWGVLTNGRKWRLYGTKNYETQTYYEVDLPELLERGDLEDFKYFYVFFRPAAFRETAETTFIDEVWSESETASQELGEDLQDNVFTALRVLGRGFVETNDLDIAPGDEEALGELKDQSLVLLYRLMFVLYAEARGLIHPEGPAAQSEYQDNFSLDQLRLDIHDEIGEIDEGFADEFSNYSTTIWSRLKDLFGLIDEGEEALGIPPYNGGLFDHSEHNFLAENEVSNRYLAEVIYRLSTTQNSDARYVLADYADLDTRHLGSVYEGLLEHQFRIAPEKYAAALHNGRQLWKPATEVTVAEAVETVPEGGLYVVNDEGERKATGAYYTPDYVVTYIVEETVGPLVKEIRENLIDQGFEPGTQEYIGPFLRCVTDLRILDPAMGSGHFLTKATGYLSEQVMSEVRDVEAEMGVAFDEGHVRREIAKECIYGVDLNGMAVELAKLSMWLETLAADRPLAFLDHHFKTGNSLVGSDIEAIEELESDANSDDGQASLSEFGATREGTIERLMEIYGEFLAIENETITDVRAMKRKYAEIEQDELRRRLVTMANVHTAERFDLDVPSGAYERMATALEDDGEWAKVEQMDWFQSAQALAEKQNFFHWKLDFPEVFYEEGGSIRADQGFDVVLGNPPYAETKGTFESYLREQYSVTEYFIDTFHAFIEQGVSITRTGGEFGYIVPEPWLTIENKQQLRKFVLEQTNIRQIVRFDRPVFPATVDTVMLIARKGSCQDEVITLEAQNADGVIRSFDMINTYSQIKLINSENNRIDTRLTSGQQNLINKIESISIDLKHIGDLAIGVQAYNRSKHSKEQIENRVFHSNIKESDEYLPQIAGSDVSRYQITYNGESWIKYGDHLHDRRDMKYLTGPRILVRQIPGSGQYKIHAAYTDETFCNYNTILNILITDKSYTPHYILAILNSALISWVFPRVANTVVTDSFPKLSVVDLQHIPIRKLSMDISEDDRSDAIRLEHDPSEMTNESEMAFQLHSLAKLRSKLTCNRHEYNISLLDYITPYADGQTLTDIATYQPPSGVVDTKLAATAEDYENLRIGTVTLERDSDTTVTVHATARYKPDDEDAHDTDQYGYTETDPMPAMRLTDLTEMEADLIEHFVPVAVDEAGGFAGFRENATKTNSLVDRLKALTLPNPDDVADDLARYIDAKARVDELDGKIEKTDSLIDEIVYRLYGLTDEDISAVEEAVADN